MNSILQFCNDQYKFLQSIEKSIVLVVLFSPYSKDCDIFFTHFICAVGR